MNILSLNNYNIPKYLNRNEGAKGLPSRNFGLKMSEPLLCDTVSFKMSPQSTQMKEFVRNAAEKRQVMLEEAAAVWLDVLESIAIKLAPYGVSFSRDYCGKNPVKSIKSRMSKILRQGSLDVRDGVRATLYLPKLKDLSIFFEHILPEIQGRGYKIADINKSVAEMRKRGYIPKARELKFDTVKAKDLDIRLGGIGDQVDKIPQEYAFCKGKPQKSGYEDIQIRFKKNKVLHELIIIYGDNYAKAKDEEYKNVYQFLRVFDEMLILKEFSDNKKSQMADSYSDSIKAMIRNEISEKLFANAKNKDVFGRDDEAPIRITQKNKDLLEGYFKSFKQELIGFYKEKIAELSTASSKEKYDMALNFREDSRRLDFIREGILNTVNQYNRRKKTPPKKQI